MNSRHTRRRPYVLSLLPIAIIVIAFLFICFSLTVRLASAHTVTVQTAGVPVSNPGAGPINTLFTLLVDPNVLFLLFIVAMIGIFLEVSHPGAILPGAIGVIALLLFLFGAGSLSPNWAGLALMALAFALLVLDIKLPAHGALTVGAAISLIIGAFLFFNSGGQQVNPILVYSMSGLVGLVGLYVVTLIVRTRRRALKTGTEGMIGANVIASTQLQPVGRVMYKGEDWTAVLDDPSASVDPGTEVRIVAVEGLLLHVQPVVDRLSDSAPRYIEG
jgi:membrane-bound serine protease (ClpP class)